MALVSFEGIRTVLLCWLSLRSCSPVMCAEAGGLKPPICARDSLQYLVARVDNTNVRIQHCSAVGLHVLPVSFHAFRSNCKEHINCAGAYRDRLVFLGPTSTDQCDTDVCVYVRVHVCAL